MEFETLVEIKHKIAKMFNTAYAECEDKSTWETSEARQNLQTQISKIKENLRINQIKCRYYKSLYKNYNKKVI